MHYLHVETADAIEAAGVCVEVSAAGLHKPVGEIYPDHELLAACSERGVPITLASDAHEPAHVGRDLDRAVEHAREAGYETVTSSNAASAAQEPLGMRVGLGADAHELVEGRRLVLGGVELDSPGAWPGTRTAT